jgi:hypothetical protein
MARQFFKVGDLVQPNSDYIKSRAYTRAQCRYGMVLSYYKTSDGLMLEIYWWPYNNTLYFPASGIRLISRSINDNVDIKD